MIEEKDNWAKYGFGENDEELVRCIKQVLESNEKAKEDIRNGPDTYPKTNTEQPEEFKKPKKSKNKLKKQRKAADSSSSSDFSSSSSDDEELRGSKYSRPNNNAGIKVGGNISGNAKVNCITGRNVKVN